MSLLEYAITRPVAIGRRGTVLIVVLFVLYITGVTLVNVAAVGYEIVSFTSTTYNDTTELWYEKLIPASIWRPQTRSCEGTVIKLQEREYLNIYDLIDRCVDCWTNRIFLCFKKLHGFKARKSF